MEGYETKWRSKLCIVSFIFGIGAAGGMDRSSSQVDDFAEIHGRTRICEIFPLNGFSREIVESEHSKNTTRFGSIRARLLPGPAIPGRYGFGASRALTS